MSQYYKPTIHEFHYGFRYEELDSLAIREREVDVDTPIGELYKLLDEGSIRVKMLDKLDLEQYSFIADGEPDSLLGEQAFVHLPSRFGLTLRYGAQSAYIVLRHLDDPLAMPGFSGECRNVNELEFLIIRLGLHHHIVYQDAEPHESN